MENFWAAENMEVLCQWWPGTVHGQSMLQHLLRLAVPEFCPLQWANNLENKLFYWLLWVTPAKHLCWSSVRGQKPRWQPGFVVGPWSRGEPWRSEPLVYGIWSHLQADNVRIELNNRPPSLSLRISWCGKPTCLEYRVFREPSKGKYFHTPSLPYYWILRLRTDVH